MKMECLIMEGNKPPVPPGKKIVGRPIQKGTVLNPGGRPKGIKEIRELAQKFAPRAIFTIAKMMDDPDCKESVRLAAATELLNRGFGRPEQAISVSHERKPVDLMTTEDIQRLLLEGIMPRHAETIEGEVINVTEESETPSGEGQEETP